MSLHPEFLKWVDAQASRAAELVGPSLPPTAPSSGVRSHPDKPLATVITEEQIMGPVVRTQLNGDGEPEAWFLFKKGKDEIGFSGAGFQEVRKITERIWNRKEIRDKFSVATVADRLMRWAVQTASGEEAESFAVRLESLLSELVVPRSVWLPIDWLSLEGELRFGDAVIAPLSLEEFERNLAENNIDSTNPMIEKMRSEWVGSPIIRFEFNAEPQRAIELAREKANDYLALLQIYALPSLTLSFTSHVAPRGAQPYRKEDILIFGQGTYRRSQAISEKPYRFDITPEIRANMERYRLATVSKLAVRTENEYEEDLLRCLLVYGRASYQSDPTDKFLQTMTAIEMFALDGANEPIQTIVADRMAFAVHGSFEGRVTLVENFKAAYAERSRGTHHGKSIEDTEIIQQFLMNAWFFFCACLQNVGRVQTRKDFLRQLDSMKYRS